VTEHADMAPPLAKLLLMLAEHGRLELLPTLLDVYRERLLAHQNVVRAAVTSAAPLSGDALQKLEQRLGVVTGKHVQLAANVDPTLIGGIVTRIGSTVYDGSVKSQLQKMKQQLIENA
jgi:F-type H+-transporting ATPase subunit delta